MELYRAARALNLELVPLDFEFLSATLGTRGSHVVSGAIELSGLDGLLVRAMPRGSLEEIIFRMDAIAAAESRGLRVINSSKTIESCIDKYLSLRRLHAAGLPVPETFVTPSSSAAMKWFTEAGGRAIVKPIFGSEGRGLLRLTDARLAQHYFELLSNQRQVIYLQEIIDHPGWDLRVFCIGDRTIAMRRSNPMDWRTNAARGATAEAYDLSLQEKELAQRAARAIGAEVCGVDMVYDSSGRILFLEVNAVPGWRHLASTTDIDIAAEILSQFRQISAH
jgi:ribosomal protein S6--L-glutamate ligase